MPVKCGIGISAEDKLTSELYTRDNFINDKGILEQTYLENETTGVYWIGGDM